MEGWSNKYAEKYWEEDGSVYCPFPYRERRFKWYRLTTEPPPPKCPFYLEQIL